MRQVNLYILQRYQKTKLILGETLKKAKFYFFENNLENLEEILQI